MAYNQNLAGRIKEHLLRLEGLERPNGFIEKKMFGGVGYLVRGNMACGVHGEHLIVRVGLERYIEALAQPGVRVFDMTGRPMSGWVMVSAEGFPDDTELERWVRQGVEFARGLPEK